LGKKRQILFFHIFPLFCVLPTSTTPLSLSFFLDWSILINADKNRKYMPPRYHAVLHELEAVDPGATLRVPSSELAKMLHRLSAAESDEVLLFLKVDPESGSVDYSRLKSEVELDLQVKQPSLKVLPQEELLYRVMKDLRVLFTKYDSNEINQRGLRDGLAQLGLVETLTLRDLLSRKALNMNFQEFVSALSRIDDKDPAALLPSGGHPRFVASKSRGIFDTNRADDSSLGAPSLRGRFDSSVKSRDPVSW